MTPVPKPQINPRYRFEARRDRYGEWVIWDRETDSLLDRALDRDDARATARDLNDPDFEPTFEMEPADA